MSEYDKGAEACDKGEECPVDAGAEFVRGYGEKYAKEQQEVSKCQNQAQKVG